MTEDAPDSDEEPDRQNVGPDPTSDGPDAFSGEEADDAADDTSDDVLTEDTWMDVDTNDEAPAVFDSTDAREAPLSGLTDDLAAGASSEAEPDPGVGEFGELFDEVDVSELDSNRLWAQLQADDGGSAVDVTDRELREIETRRYCHQCVHFSDPPAVRCEHDGTTILELVDVETFRVANCPVVLEEESLEDR